MTLSSQEYEVVLNWVRNNFIPTKNINYNITAYNIHGIFERLYDKGFYIDEDTTVKALRECGYLYAYKEGQWYFNISPKSRAVQIYRASVGAPSKECKFEWY